MTSEQINLLVQHYIHTSLQECEEDRLTKVRSEDEWEAVSMGYTNMLEDTQGRLIANDFSKVIEVAEELLQAHQVSFDRQSIGYKRLGRELLIARQKILRIELDRIDGNYWDEPLGPIGPTVPGQSVPHSFANTSSQLAFVVSKPLTEVMGLYFKENQRKPRTDGQIKSGFEKFLQVVGGDRPIQEITKTNCRQYKDALLKLPRAMSAHDRSKGVNEVLESLPSGNYQTLGASTVNKYLHNLAHFFDWSKRQGFYEGENPAHGLTISKRHIQGREKRKRKPFTAEDIKLIFGSPNYLKQRVENPERFWIPLLLLHTGARREEVSQLDLDDVKQEQGVFYFNVTPDEERGKGLKNEGSKRRVPVHSYLVETGFLSYVKELRGRGEERLFPELLKGRNGYGDAVGKWFGRHLDKLGIKDPSKVIHSFRHTVNTKLHELRVPQAYILALIGHEGDSMNERDYLHGKEYFAISALKEELEKLDFSGSLQNGLVDLAL